jgi:hypothetical protein
MSHSLHSLPLNSLKRIYFRTMLQTTSDLCSNLPQNYAPIYFKTMLQSTSNLCSNLLQNYAPIYFRTMLHSTSELCSILLQNYAPIYFRTMLHSTSELCPNLLQNYAPVYFRTMLQSTPMSSRLAHFSTELSNACYTSRRSHPLSPDHDNVRCKVQTMKLPTVQYSSTFRPS